MCGRVGSGKLWSMGGATHREKEYAEAVGELEQAVKLDPKNATIVSNPGFTLYKLAKFRESIVWVQKAIAIDHRRAIAYLNLADAYVRVGKPKEAKQNYEKFLELSPGSAN